MYTAVITKVSEISTGGNYEVRYTIYNGDKSNQWEEVLSTNTDQHPTYASVEEYVKKRIKYYENANSVVADIKKEIGKEITSNSF